MTDTEDRLYGDDEQGKDTVEIPSGHYDLLRDSRSQMVGEGWVNIGRIDDENYRARPVDRQEGRGEGELVESDEWLIEDVNGETYTVSDETFQEKYDTIVTEQVTADLSIDPVETEPGEPDIGGTEIIVEMTAYIDLPHQVVDNFSVDRVSVDGNIIDGLPLEVLEDHGDIGFMGTGGSGDN